MTLFWQAAKEELGNQPKKKGGKPREGIARCTFEDKIKMSDIVFMRAWASVEVPRFYNPLTTALQPCDQTWQGTKTIAEFPSITQVMQVLKMLPLIYFQLRVYCKCIVMYH